MQEFLLGLVVLLLAPVLAVELLLERLLVLQHPLGDVFSSDIVEWLGKLDLLQNAHVLGNLKLIDVTEAG